jgi:Phytanoyl-CoA dioxygenase (PhyH)
MCSLACGLERLAFSASERQGQTLLMDFNVENHGFAIVAGVVDAAARQNLLSAIGPFSGAGRRGLLALSAVAELAHSATILELVHPHLTSEPIPVRAIYFDKSPNANWLVSWHQDLTVALRERVEVSGYGPWSTKAGIPHVQPPVGLLEQMLAVRIHLDDANQANGALRVLPGSHNSGRLSPEQIQELRDKYRDVPCIAKAGDVMLMRPLLLHASSRSSTTGHRRVVHIEYAAFELPSVLHWHDAA